jgi:hypothetical protein
VTPSEANQLALSRLAMLLRRRYFREVGRDFVVLAVEPRPPRTTDELVTQPMAVLRGR